MTEAWVSFAVVVFIQFVLFIIYAALTRRLRDIPRLLLWGAGIGVVVGLSFDLVIGKWLGINSYVLGFGLPFLLINGALSYGLFAANTLLMNRVRLLHFYLYTLVIVAVYEIANLYFPVWAWEFSLPSLGFLAVLFAGYWGGAVLVALIAHTVLKYRFSFLHILLKR